MYFSHLILLLSHLMSDKPSSCSGRFCILGWTVLAVGSRSSCKFALLLWAEEAPAIVQHVVYAGAASSAGRFCPLFCINFCAVLHPVLDHVLGGSASCAGLFCPLFCRLVGWSDGWTVGWMAGWLAGWTVGRFVGWLVRRLDGWLVC